MRPEPKWKPGDAVVLANRKVGNRLYGRKEYGRVIDSFWDRKWQWYNVYVAFYGYDRMPDNSRSLKDKPYVLRYLESSLAEYKPNVRRVKKPRTRSGVRRSR